jgi:hypothetical protein
MIGRQLDIFGGKRQRGVKLPSPKEYELHCMVADALHRWCHPDWRYTHIPAGEYRTPATAARLARMGVRPGWPDFVFISKVPGSPAQFMELKRRGGRLSPDQEDFARHARAGGCGHYVVDSFDDALRVLRDAGIVRVKVST